MDYYIYWIVGRRIYGGSDSTERFGFAARIVDGDAESWQREWGDLASRVEDRGRAALGSGEVAGARAAYSRARTLPQN